MHTSNVTTFLAFLTLAFTLQAFGPRASHAQTGDVRDVPDPAIIKFGDAYLVFSTAAGIPIRKSEDLIHWEVVGHVFDELPAWIEEEVPGVEFPWAPDIAFFNDQYHLYYSLSTFGSQRSVIALATNQTLDPTDPAYRWVDRGKVVESHPATDDFNAIDPNVAFDEAGRPWLAWGSFWGGIRLRRLDAETGLVSAEDTAVYALASRPVEKAIEAPYIIGRGSWYYLFVSFDACCRGAESTYRVMVGRSGSITGPYEDRSGRAMMQGGGTLVLEGYGRMRGPGHNAVLTEGDRHYLVHHFYDAEDEGVSKLQIRPLLWREDGWPLAGEPYDGGFPALPGATEPDLVGTWGHAVGSARPTRIRFFEGGRVERCDGEGTWSLDGTSLTLRWSAGNTPEGLRTATGIVSPDGEWYVGRTQNGTVVRGYRVE